MHITQEMRQQACEGLLHFTPKKALARELGVSVGSIRDWAIYIQHCIPSSQSTLRVQNVRSIHLPSDKNGAVPGGF